MTRVKSGGAGNKMLMLLEGKGAAYIQDRGVSRWDTCGAQAVLEATGGSLFHLRGVLSAQEGARCYTYLKTERNLDFEPNLTKFSKFNASDREAAEQGGFAGDVTQLLPYANVLGLFAVSAANMSRVPELVAAATKAAEAAPPAYD